MKRLTSNTPLTEAEAMNLSLTNLYARLKEYEDTGLELEETAKLLREAILIKQELDEYTTAKREGRLLILPCKVGDTVWKIVRHRVDVSGYRMEWEWETYIEAVKFSIGMFEAIGKTVFLTRAEAEAALRGCGNETAT